MFWASSLISAKIEPKTSYYLDYESLDYADFLA